MHILSLTHSAGMLLALSAILSGRAQDASLDSHRTKDDIATDSTYQYAQELPLPAVPATLREPHARAEYIMEHFWDKMDFTDTLYSRNPNYMEQNIVNYLSLFPHATRESLPRIISGLLKKSSADTGAFNLVADLTEMYLNAPDSPMRNESYYILFLEELLRMSQLEENVRMRHEQRLKTARKNCPGMTAADFSYISKDNRTGTLHRIQCEQLLLLFYDPDCMHCMDAVKELSESLLLDQLIDSGKVTVLAVYTEGDRNVWEKTKDAMPQKWLVGFDATGIVERQLYSLPVMPVIYLLDKDKTVMLKDTNTDMLRTYLNTSSPFLK